MYTLKDVERFLLIGGDELDSAGVFLEMQAEFDERYNAVCEAIREENGLANFSELYQVSALDIVLGQRSSELFHELRHWVRTQVQSSATLADMF